ncbi:tetraspanin 6 isoform X1 [Halictus rubicundus]|uniref:tetraspanin 6 isoform X1 n=1 Tax=Halictus rubicundus TaxID=77578 RepID=UPI00403692DD
MGCGMGMIKYLLFIFNFIFAICGIGILTVGILACVRLSSVTESLNTNVMFPAITLIVLGSIIFIISFFGCCGAIRESHCMTITFASFLLFILLVQVAVAVYAFVVVKNPENSISRDYRSIFNDYPQNKDSRDFIDAIQVTFRCCGVESPNDYTTIYHNFTTPWSCCGKEQGQSCTMDESHREGCAPILMDAIKMFGGILGGVAIGIAGVELIGIIFALCLANSIRNTERRGYRV